MGTGDILLEGKPAMDYHPVQGGVAILLGMLHAKETGIGSDPFGPLARVRLYLTFLILNNSEIVADVMTNMHVLRIK